MTLRIGDHLVVKRDGKILTEKDEAYHEYEVLKAEYSYLPDGKYPPKSGCDIKSEVVQ